MTPVVLGWPVAGLAVVWGAAALRGLRPAAASPACGRCGYSVVGLVVPTCPECGGDLRRVGVTGGRRRSVADPFVGWTGAFTVAGVLLGAMLLTLTEGILPVRRTYETTVDLHTAARSYTISAAGRTWSTRPIRLPVDIDVETVVRGSAVSVGSTLTADVAGGPVEWTDSAGRRVSAGPFGPAAVRRWLAANGVAGAVPVAEVAAVCAAAREASWARETLQVGPLSSLAGPTAIVSGLPADGPADLSLEFALAGALAWAAGVGLVWRETIGRRP